MYIFSFFFLNFILIELSYSQSEINFSSQKKVFQKFVKPKISNLFFEKVLDENSGFNNIYITCFFQIDTAGKIIYESYSPILGVGNDFKIDDAVWTDIIDSIKAVSKSWIFKPNFWKWDNLKFRNWNKKATSRPNLGLQNHLMIIEYRGSKLTSFNKLYLINPN
ncbi:MAG: hypothetical protein KGZ59_00550 [Chitinophagaceae bacterium]|nr:hypothetical protein [Chitinophagaceae bacterium]